MLPWHWLQFWKAAAFNGEKCYVFDRDGSGCRRQRCGTEMYDASVCLEKIGDIETKEMQPAVAWSDRQNLQKT